MDINKINLSQVAKVGLIRSMSASLSFKDGDAKNKENLTKREKAYLIDKVPDLLTWLSYVHFPATMIGPFVEFATFDEFIHLRGRFADLKPFEAWPSAFKRFIQGWLCAAMSLAIPSIFIPNNPSRDYMLTEDFIND